MVWYHIENVCRYESEGGLEQSIIAKLDHSMHLKTLVRPKQWIGGSQDDGKAIFDCTNRLLMVS
eukprot:scaffold7221_cov165-Amphora_coffeaeformis.AAC.3